MTILNTIDVVATNNQAWFGISACVLLIGLSLAILSFGEGRQERNERLLGIAMLGVAVLSLVLAKATSREYKTGEIRLEATLDESVSARAILEEYEIVDIRGEIYTLKPLDAAEDKQ